MSEKPTKEEIEANPQRYKALASGAIYDREAGHIVAHTGKSPHQFNSITGRQAVERRKRIGERSVLRGLVDAAREQGIELPDPDTISDEELEAAGGDALRLLTKHTALTYLGSKNLRGMGEIFSKLTAPYVMDKSGDREEPAPSFVYMAIIRDLATAAREIEQKKVIPGDVIDAD